jgi:PEP-CTERM motif
MSVMISPRDVRTTLRRPGTIWGLAAIVWLGIASSSQAQLDGWGTDGGPGSPTLVSQSTYGVTLGTNALQSTNPQNSFWGPSTGNLVTVGQTAALANATKISFDLTMIGTQMNGGAAFSGFAQSNELAIELFSNPGGTLPSGINIFAQKNFAAGNGTDTSGQSATWSGVDGTRTITYDLTQFTDPNMTDATFGETIAQILTQHPDIQDAKISFVEQMGGGSAPGNFFFDNVKLLDGGGNTLAIIGNFEPVPEPSSFALAALVVAPLVGVVRRRRKAARVQPEATPATP